MITHLETPPLRAFMVREGNGNDGEWYRIHVLATDAFSALRAASRAGYIYKPKSVTFRDCDGDDHSAYLAKFDSRMDYCPWTASATLDDEETANMDDKFVKLRNY